MKIITKVKLRFSGKDNVAEREKNRSGSDLKRITDNILADLEPATRIPEAVWEPSNLTNPEIDDDYDHFIQGYFANQTLRQVSRKIAQNDRSLTQENNRTLRNFISHNANNEWPDIIEENGNEKYVFSTGTEGIVCRIVSNNEHRCEYLPLCIHSTPAKQFEWTYDHPTRGALTFLLHCNASFKLRSL